MIGINDLADGIDSEEVYKKYKNIIQRISEKSPGTKIYIQSLLPVNMQLLVNLIDFGVDVQGAVDAPRWRSMPGGELLLENRFPLQTVDYLAKQGHHIEQLTEFSPFMGSAQAIKIDREQQLLTGGADGRRMACGLGI